MSIKINGVYTGFKRGSCLIQSKKTNGRDKDGRVIASKLKKAKNSNYLEVFFVVQTAKQ